MDTFSKEDYNRFSHINVYIFSGGIKMKHIGYYNGDIGPLEEMRVPMLDRAVFFGDSCYEMVNFRNKRAFGLHDHLNRFYNSLKFLKINFDMSLETLAGEIQKLIDMNECDCGTVYWQGSRGTAMRYFTYDSENIRGNLLMYTSPNYLEPQEHVYSLKSHEDTRFLHCNIKTTNLIPAVMYSQSSLEDGCQESILHRGDRVTECGHSNVVILKDGVLCAPPKDNLILPGVTMSNLLMLAEKNDVPVRIAPFTMDELKNADEIIITSTGVPCIRALSLDGEEIGGRDPGLLHKLQKAYMDFFISETDRTPVLDEMHY